MANAEQNGDGRIATRATGPATSPPDLSGFAQRVAVAVLIALGLLILAAVAWRGIHVLLEAFAGVLFGVFLAALADWVHKRTRLSYGWSLALVLAALGALAVGGGWMLASRMALQMREMIADLPKSVERAQAYLSQYPWGQFLLQLPQTAGASSLGGTLSHGGKVFSSLAGFLEAVLVILVVGIFGAAEPDIYKAGLSHLVPPHKRARAGQAVDAVTFNLRAWLVGQAVLMVVMGVTTALALTLLGVPFALALGLIAGVLEIIPYLGAWLSAAPAALIALAISPWHMAMVLGLYLGLHVLEGYVLLPLIQRRAVHLPPALTLVMQVLLGELLGLTGLLVAAPLTVASVVLVKMFYVEDALGDQDVSVPGEPGNENKPAAQKG